MLEFAVGLSILNFAISFALSVFVLGKHFSTHQVSFVPANQINSPATAPERYDVDEELEKFHEAMNGEMDTAKFFDEVVITK